MFEQLIKTPGVVERYRKAPFAAEREQFLRNFHGEGHSRSRLVGVNIMLQAVVTKTPSVGGIVSVSELQVAADTWLASRRRHHRTERTTCGMRRDFVSIGSQFLRSLGRLVEPPTRSPFLSEIDAFLNFLAEERGLSESTLIVRKRSLQHFLAWLADRAESIATVAPRTITEYFSVERGWARTTVKIYVSTLRTFFRYAAGRNWCDPRLAKSIDAPRIFTLESLPQGLLWSDVQRLITGLAGPDPNEIRDRAVIMLLAVYGLRMREVLTLTLDDLDWSAERVNVHRSKQHKRQQLPLCAEVGDAIVRYLREVRPRSPHREVFLTARMPHRPYSRTGLSKAIEGRLKGLGVALTHYGSHVLRHACATHLLTQGFSLNEIGGHLGHRSAQATKIYTKVDLESLRQVAEFPVNDLAGVAMAPESLERTYRPAEKLAALRELANLGAGGVA